MPPDVRVRAREVPLQWHEAVAVVQEVISELAIGRITRVPSAEDLRAGHDGRLSLRSPGAAEGSGAAPRSRVHAAGLLLQDLLGSDAAPDALRRLVGDAVATPPRFTALEELAASLAFFERPGRQHVLAALAGRLLVNEERLRVESALDSLTQKTRTDNPKAPQEGPDSARPLMGRREVMLGVAVLAAVLLVGLVAVVSRWRPAGVVSFQSARQVMADTGGRLLDVLRAPATGAADTPTDEGSQRSTSVPSQGRSRQRRSLAATASTRAPAAALPLVVSDALPAVSPLAPPFPVSRGAEPDTVAGAVDEVLYIEPAEDPPVEDDVPAARVYASEDVEVAPPVILRPQLPTISPPGAPADQSGALDAVISEDGRVERIRLVASPVHRRYYDAMLLAAAKTWQFRPALKDGRPVRYRIRIPLTQ